MKTYDEKLLNDITDYIKNENGRSPSYRGIMHKFNLSSLSIVARYINRLQVMGLIQKNNLGEIDISRRYKSGQTIIAPMVGTVACGSPIYAEQNIEETYSLPVALFGNQKLVGLRAQGESMINVGIFDGDAVFYLPCDDADSGEIVVALIDKEGTIKRYEKNKNCVIFHPENPEYDDIVPKPDQIVKIQGIVKHVVHSF